MSSPPTSSTPGTGTKAPPEQAEAECLISRYDARVRGKSVVFLAIAVAACDAGEVASPSPRVDLGQGAPAAAPLPPLVVEADTFRVTLDPRRGGEATTIEVPSEAGWGTLVGSDGQTFPALVLRTADTSYSLASDPAARVLAETDRDGVMSIQLLGRPRDLEGRPGPFEVTLGWEIHPEGAIFADVDVGLVTERPEWGHQEPVVLLGGAELGLALDRGVPGWPRYRQEVVRHVEAAFPSVRVALGASGGRSFTNELEAFVEDGRGIGGLGTAFDADATSGRFHWTLARGTPLPVDRTFHAQNRVALALGRSRQVTSLTGDRAYHWVGLDAAREADKAWYPTDDEIDRMVALGATVLVLHNFWMAQGGTNGSPAADYRTPRDEAELRRTIAHAHERGLRVGLYLRGVERYAAATGFFEKYLERDRDGLYVDWLGPHATSFHESRLSPATALGDVHATSDGSRLPARDSLLFMKDLRNRVGPRGFLIGHQGSLRSGALSNLLLDSYLAGEAPSDQTMMTSADDAAYGGMEGAGPCSPWTVAAPNVFTTPDAIAKMAAWGLIPEIPLGIYGFPNDPMAPENAYALAYWRILAAGGAERASSVMGHVSSPVSSVKSRVYVQPTGELLVVTVNLSAQPIAEPARITLDGIGAAVGYHVSKVDPASGAVGPLGDALAGPAFDVLSLGPWEIAGYLLQPH
jgi:hypothetical protein